MGEREPIYGNTARAKKRGIRALVRPSAAAVPNLMDLRSRLVDIAALDAQEALQALKARRGWFGLRRYFPRPQPDKTP